MSEINSELDKLYTIKEVARYFQLTRQTLNTFEKQKKLIPIRIGSNIRYRKRDIEEFIKQETTKNEQ